MTRAPATGGGAAGPTLASCSPRRALAAPTAWGGSRSRPGTSRDSFVFYSVTFCTLEEHVWHPYVLPPCRRRRLNRYGGDIGASLIGRFLELESKRTAVGGTHAIKVSPSGTQGPRS